jgi:hypothetical protein
VGLFIVQVGGAAHGVPEDVKACLEMVSQGLMDVPEDRSRRFIGKVDVATARCRGGEKAVAYRHTPWVDWSNYWAVGDAASKKAGPEAMTLLGEHTLPNGRGIDGALLDLEFQRVELIKFNLFDNYTYETYIKGNDEKAGPAVKQWPEMRLSPAHPLYSRVGGEGEQLCAGELVRKRTLDGVCNDIYNPKMGATGTLFSRNVEFESTYPRLGKNELAVARHSDPENGMRIGLLKPDPQLISQKLFTRESAAKDPSCNGGQGLPDYSTEAACAYQSAPFFNVLAAFWIQFMTHDWLSHLEEGRNRRELVGVGCDSAKAQALGCRPGDRMEPALIEVEGDPETFSHENKTYLSRAYKATKNFNTAWWDASQIYGYDRTSMKRVLRDPVDPAKLLQHEGYLPVFEDCDIRKADCVVQPQWRGQEAAAFPDNWSIGLSFYHNVFVREHNAFVEAFRTRQQAMPEADSGLRHPERPNQMITYAQASDNEIYEAARLVVSAGIAKIHTIEWTTQLLYNEPLYKAMNANWFGLFDSADESKLDRILKRVVRSDESWLGKLSGTIAGWLDVSGDDSSANSWYSVLASGSGIFGLNNTRETGFLWWKKDGFDISNPDHLNGGVNHFGSPFNFPEEFMTVYRLHTLVPDLIEYREIKSPNSVTQHIPLIQTIRGEATEHMKRGGIENWALSMGRQRLGLLHLRNHPQFLQKLPMPHLNSPTGKLDIAALDLIRDRERGVPRFNEFRRQIGLKSMRSFDDFVDHRLPVDSPARREQEAVIQDIREIYGTHVCDDSKVISVVQRDDEDQFITDCHGFPDGSVVDNIEDVDTVVGWLAEYTRPHGFAISETQFHVFIINASRRLFSDRFFTSSFRPEFYSNLGYDWVINNGPYADCPYPLDKTANGEPICNEPELVNGHKMMVSPLKRLLIRTIPSLKAELMPVKNAFDPWARDRGEYYNIAWEPRSGATDDPAFQ